MARLVGGPADGQMIEVQPGLQSVEVNVLHDPTEYSIAAYGVVLDEQGPLMSAYLPILPDRTVTVEILRARYVRKLFERNVRDMDTPSGSRAITWSEFHWVEGTGEAPKCSCGQPLGGDGFELWGYARMCEDCFLFEVEIE